MLKYPTGLPAALKSGQSFQMVDPLVSTPFDSGQTRWDRQFTDTPTVTPIAWIFTNVEFQAFGAWYRDQLRSGAEWFEMPVRSPVGRRLEQCHFASGYSGPTPLGYDRWRVDGQLVLRRQPLPGIGEGFFPDEILASDLFDKTINLEWPT